MQSNIGLFKHGSYHISNSMGKSKYSNFSDHIIRCKSSSKIQSLINYACNFLSEHFSSDPNQWYVIVQGTGVTTSKVVEVVERVKEQFSYYTHASLHQENKIGSLVFDQDNIQIDQTHLGHGTFQIDDQASVRGFRRVSCMEVKLSAIKNSNGDDVGYQFDEYVKPTKASLNKNRNTYHKKPYHHGYKGGYKHKGHYKGHFKKHNKPYSYNHHAYKDH